VLARVLTAFTFSHCQNTSVAASQTVSVYTALIICAAPAVTEPAA